MNELMEGLGRLVREEEAVGAKIDRLAAALEPGEVARLEQELGLDSSVVRAAYEPLSERAKARMVSAILQAVREPSPVARPEPARGRFRLQWALAPVLTAAAILSVWWRSASNGVDAPLASYTLEVRGRVALERAAPTAPGSESVLLPDAIQRVTLVLRPEHSVSGLVGARVFLASGTQTRELASEVARAESGALKVDVDLGEGLPASGHFIVWVGREAALQAMDALQSVADGPAAGPGWQRLVRRFERQPR